jgi:hypothetical protein
VRASGRGVGRGETRLCWRGRGGRPLHGRVGLTEPVGLIAGTPLGGRPGPVRPCSATTAPIPCRSTRRTPAPPACEARSTPGANRQATRLEEAVQAAPGQKVRRTSSAPHGRVRSVPGTVSRQHARPAPLGPPGSSPGRRAAMRSPHVPVTGRTAASAHGCPPARRACRQPSRLWDLHTCGAY